MNCCDYNCTQGRDCPARVAHIGQRHLAAEPLPPTTWRRYLPDLCRAFLVLLTTALCAVLGIIIVMGAA